ncbi:MAG: hypothetical protein HC913_06430 [Microscillaceae bacterium]|nr:hypothetical protein [Microscillaceae bacterium]
MLPFDFNAYSALLLPSFIQGLLFALLLLWRYGRQRQSGDLFLAGILAVLSLKVAFWMLGYAGWYNRLDAYTTFMFYFPFNNFILIGPLLYFYFLSSSNAHFKLEKNIGRTLSFPCSIWG